MRLGFDGLKRIAAALDHKILAVVENLDALFYRGVSGGKKEADAEQWGLRKCLQDAEFLLLLGAAPTYFGAASDQGAAFHGFFREHTLDSLELDEVIHIAREHLVWVAEGGSGPRAERARELLERFEANKGRLAGMLRITGGLPRFAHLIVDLLIDAEDTDAETQLERILDEQTPYFQGRLDPRLIPPAELEALATIARASGPLRPSELARRLGAQTGEASVLLERLRERGLARRSGSHGGAVAWDVAEPLYRVWMAFREGGEQRSTMIALTEMVAALYSVDELQARVEAASNEAGADDVWGLALARGPSLDGEEKSPGAAEIAFQAAQHALDEAEKKGELSATVLINYTDSAWETGRIALGRPYVEAMIQKALGRKNDHAEALFVAAKYGGPNAAARASAAAAIFEEIGRPLEALLAKGRHGFQLHLDGHKDEATTLLASTYQTALEQNQPTFLLSRLAMLTSRSVTLQDQRKRWADIALSHAIDGSAGEANARMQLSTMAVTTEEWLGLTQRAAALYRDLGHYRDLGYVRIERGDHYTAMGDLEAAVRELADAVDVFLEQDALFDVHPWGRLHDFVAWGARPVALLALHELAACVNHDKLRETAEPWLVLAAIRLIAERNLPLADVVELLETARDDLTRERRPLLETVVLAARLEAEPSETVLFERAEPLRDVVTDVTRRVKEARKKSARKRPTWAVPPSKRPAASK
jgi:hypothetical protein